MHQQFVTELATRIATEIDPARVLCTVAEAIGPKLACSRILYGEVDLPTESFDVLLDWTDGVPSLEGQHKLYADSAITRHYLTGRVLVVDDARPIAITAEEERLLEEARGQNFVSAPLLHDGELSALFAASDHRPRIWRADEVALIEAIGPVIWRALNHLRLLRRVGGKRPSAMVPSRGPSQTLWISDGRRQRGIPAGDVEWIEAERDYALIHTKSGARHMVRQRMAAIEQLVDPNAILRVHRSAFVAAEAVRSLEVQGQQAVLVLHSGAVVRVGPLYLDRVQARFAPH